MTLQFPPRFVLLDTEYTSWKKQELLPVSSGAASATAEAEQGEAGGRRVGSQPHGGWGPGQYKEIIQIGAIIVSGWEEEDSFSVFVKPVKNPMLSDFIKNLTGITQEIVDQEGLSLENSLARTASFIGDLPIYAYGIDGEVIQKNCALIDIQNPLSPDRVGNMRPMVFPLLERLGIDPKAYTSGTLLQAFGKQGAAAHDAVNDMRNLLVALKEIKTLG